MERLVKPSVIPGNNKIIVQSFTYEPPLTKSNSGIIISSGKKIIRHFIVAIANN